MFLVRKFVSVVKEEDEKLGVVCGVTHRSYNVGKTFVIGDVHGCYIEAIELFDRCKVTSSDRVIFIGDIVDRGPDNDKCVDLAMKYECILGNHENRHLNYRRDNETPQSTSHLATQKQLRPEHYEYFKSLPLKIELPEHNAVVVHAGVLPWRPIQAQEKYHLLHTQMVRPFDDDMLPSTKTKWPSRVRGETGWQFWANLWYGPEKIIFGHTTLSKPILADNLAGVDGGCCHGRELWALDVDAWKVIAVKARKQHAFYGNQPKTYVIYDDVHTW